MSALTFAAVAGLAGCKETQPPAPPAPPLVTVARPQSESLADYLDFTGTTAAVRTVTVVARVEGYLERIHFKDGQKVRKGDLLFTIQQAQYRAQLKQAEAQVLAQKSKLKHAVIELARYQQLLTQDAATETTVDRWQAEKEEAEAGIQSAVAQVELARLNLGYTEVRAPFDGRIGRHLAEVGSLVGAMGQQTSLAEINQIDPVYVYFTIDERELLRVKARYSRMPPGTLTQGTVPAALGLLTEEGFPHRGYLDFGAIGVTPNTGTLQVRGVFPNPDSALLPGVFARVRVAAMEKADVLTIPGEAVSFDQQGEFVRVVNASNIVERRGVKLGQQIGDRLAITAGLRPDDRVVVEGLLQAAPGREVRPQWAGAALLEAAPAPR